MRRALKHQIRNHPLLHATVARMRYSRLSELAPVRSARRAWIELRRRQLRLPDQVDVELTSRCQSRCPMCPQVRLSRPGGDMDPALYRRIVDLAAAEGVSRLNLNNIGEPLLVPALPRRVAEARERGLEVGFHTNGQALTPARISALVEAGIGHIGISLNAASAATHRRIHPGLEFSRVEANVEALLAARRKGRPWVSVTFVVQHANHHELRAFQHRWRSRVDDVVIRSPRSWAGSVPLKAPSVPGPRYPCKHLWGRMVVLNDGRVALCAIDHDGEEILGDLGRLGIHELWNGPRIRHLRSLHLAGRMEEIPICARCEVRESWW